MDTKQKQGLNAAATPFNPVREQSCLGLEQSLSDPLPDAAAQACASELFAVSVGVAARSRATPDGPKQFLLRSPPRHIKNGQPHILDACAMQEHIGIQGPPSPNTRSGKVDLVGTNLNSSEHMHAMQQTPKTRNTSTPPSAVGQQDQDSIHTKQQSDETHNHSVSPSTTGQQDQGGLPPPDEQTTASSCKLHLLSPGEKCSAAASIVTAGRPAPIPKTTCSFHA